MPALASDLNARWAAARLSDRLDRRGVAHLRAVFPAGADMRPPLLFIIGDETRAVRQAQRWADTASLSSATSRRMSSAAAAAVSVASVKYFMTEFPTPRGSSTVVLRPTFMINKTHFL